MSKLKDQLNDALDKGARLLYGGKYERLLFYPTLIDNVSIEMKVMREEVFGPLRPIITVSNEDDAIKVENSTEYGLSAGIITGDVQKAFRIAKKLETRMVHINDLSVFDEPWAPFGEVKCSRIGREGGKYSIQEMTHVR